MLKSISKRLVATAVAASACMFSASASAAYALSFQGVDFTFTEVTSTQFTLRMQNALSTTNLNWAPAEALQALGFKDLGIDFSASGVGATLTAAPPGSTNWTGINAELNAQGCSTSGDPDQAICFTGVPPLALADDMTFTIDITGGASLDIDPDLGPHLKIQFVEDCAPAGRGPCSADGWKKVGSLMSKNLPFDDGGDDDEDDDDEVPEPATLALVGLALSGLAISRRRSRGQ